MYRSEVEALRERVRTLEHALQEERAKSAALQQQLHNVLNPPPPPPAPPVPGMETLMTRAWLAVAPTIVVAVMLTLLTATIHLAHDNAFWLALFPWIALGLVITIPLGIYFANKPIKARTEYDGTAMVFVTWFWLPFCIFFPIIGVVFALHRAYVLVRGKFSAFTVTQNGSTTSHYGPVELHGEGYPAASVFAVIALLQLLGASLGIG